MKITILAVTGLFAIGCTSKPQADHAAIKAEIERLLEIQESNYGDHSPVTEQTVAYTVSDSVMFIGGDDGGFAMSATEYIRDLADGYKIKPYDRYFRIYDNTVIVTSKHQGFKLLADDTLLLNCRSTKVFVKERTEWKMAYVTYAPLPIVYFSKVKPNPAKLPDYGGVYRLERGVTDSVSVSDGRLYSSINGAKNEELYALNDSTFIGEGYFGKAVFSRNKAGKVTHYYFEWTDGQQIIFPKIR